MIIYYIMDILTFINDPQDLVIFNYRDSQRIETFILSNLKKGLSLFEICDRITCVHYYSPSDGQERIVSVLTDFIEDIFNDNKFELLGLQVYANHEEAALELLKQTKDGHVTLRRAISRFISYERVDLWREYLKYAHLIDWSNVNLYDEGDWNDILDTEKFKVFVRFVYVFRKYIRIDSYFLNSIGIDQKYIAEFAELLRDNLPKCNKYKDTIDGYSHGIQPCGCFFHTESILDLVISSKK